MSKLAQQQISSDNPAWVASCEVAGNDSSYELGHSESTLSETDFSMVTLEDVPSLDVYSGMTFTLKLEDAGSTISN